MGSGNGDPDDHDLQHPEPAGAVPAVPLPGHGVRRHRTGTDPLPAGQRHRSFPARAGGGTQPASPGVVEIPWDADETHLTPLNN
jgi:hypothetical protein